SRSLSEEFIRENEVARHLFPDQWDSHSGSWKTRRRTLRDKVSSVIARMARDEGQKSGDTLGPSMWQTIERFDKDVRAIRSDPQTDLITVEFQFRNPQVAANWANAYVELGDRELRQRAIAEAERAIKYLNEEAAGTTLAELRATIY